MALLKLIIMIYTNHDIFLNSNSNHIIYNNEVSYGIAHIKHIKIDFHVGRLFTT